MNRIIYTTGAALLLLLNTSKLSAQAVKEQEKAINWQHLDLESDGIFGISTNRAYEQLLKGKKAKEITVAVIDGGVDTSHTDLKPILWHQAGKWGWNFLSSKKGNVNQENLELTRLVREGQARFSDLEHLPSDTAGLWLYRKRKDLFLTKYREAKQSYESISGFKRITDTIFNEIGKAEPTIQDLKAYVPQTETQASVKQLLLNDLREKPDLKAFREKELQSSLDHWKEQLDYALNLSFDARTLVGDNVNDLRESNYGSNDVMGPDAAHGTHVSGIIGAIRNNGIGLDGVANHVKILNIRAVPNGDERDKDIANAIIYAVNKGAKVINMSFGKPYSPNKARVDEAVRYAMSKDVLLVHAAGNNGEDLDAEGRYFPSKVYADGSGEAKAWLDVGASDQKNDLSLVASFSNFGKSTVDVFAPGVGIYSTVPGSGYRSMNGTSMAAPMVSGLAALIRSYFPKLTAEQVKEIIMNSVNKVDHEVYVKKSGRKAKVPFSELCVSGGIINAYRAIELAGKYNKK